MNQLLLTFTLWDDEYLTFIEVGVITIEFLIEATWLKNRVTVYSVSSCSVFKLFRPAYCSVGSCNAAVIVKNMLKDLT